MRNMSLSIYFDEDTGTYTMTGTDDAKHELIMECIDENYLKTLRIGEIIKLMEKL